MSGNEKILAYGIRMQKNPQTREDILQIFMELSQSKVQLASLHKSFINGITNPEIVYPVKDYSSFFLLKF